MPGQGMRAQGMRAQGAAIFANQISAILTVNRSNGLATDKGRSVTAGSSDALRLRCAATGFTIDLGRSYTFTRMEELRRLTPPSATATGTAASSDATPASARSNRV